MTGLPTIPGGFPVIVADPPWHFKSNSAAKPGRNAMSHYSCMSLDDIAALPVKDIAAPDAICFLWITGPFLVLGAHSPIMKAWGFKPTAIGFTWAKTRKLANMALIRPDDWHMAGGYTTRKNTEICLIGKRGKSLRQSNAVRELIIAPVGRHSEKPDAFFDRVEQYAEGPYVELFSRRSRPGWISWGREAGKLDGI